MRDIFPLLTNLTRATEIGRATKRCLIVILAAVFALLQHASADTSDAPLLPIPPVRQCEPGAIFTGTQDYNPSAPDWTGYAYPWNLIYKEWMRIGGPNSPIGCPVGQSVTDSAGTYVQFEHGQIAASPNVWEQGVVAAYQDPIAGIVVDWTVSWDDPSHYNYTKFVVRWDFNGQHYDDVTLPDGSKPCERGDGDQCDVLADMTEVQAFLLHYFHDTHLRTKGAFSVPVDHGNGNYRIAIEGCDEGKVGGSTCRQGWMHGVEVNFQAKTDDTDAYPIDMRIAPTATDVSSSRAAFFKRAAAVTLYNACRLLPWSVYRNEEQYMTIILAKLDYANYYQGDKCPGRVIDNRPEAFASLAKQGVESRAGTTIDSCPGCRTGEYDVALSGYIPIINRFGGILPNDVLNHIVNDLLNKRGPLDLGDHSVSINIPESENHINMIESSRYLTNDLLYARTGDSQYDNHRNSVPVMPDLLSDESEQIPPDAAAGTPVLISMRDYWLRRLHHILQTDFIEYNARPYQGYTMRAIQNLYSFTNDPQVKAAAEMVLNYVSAKLAASSNDNRRAVPYRRKAEYNNPNLLGWQSDPQAARMLALVGDLKILTQATVTDEKGPFQHDFFAPWYGQDDMQMAIESSYRIPDLILDSLINPKHRLFYQGIHHYADELYAASPSYLISAGGHYATSAYKAFGIFGKDDDIGMALPTTVMPTRFFRSRNDLIRFEGSTDNTTRSNMCAAPNFACGINPVLPDSMRPEALASGCSLINGPWTFIDFSSICRNGDNGFPEGFYAALFRRDAAVINIDGERVGNGYGFVEVFDRWINPDVTFTDFWCGVLTRYPADTVFASTCTSPGQTADIAFNLSSRHNVYVTTTGQKITFEFFPDSRIVGIENGPAPVQSTTDMATGTIIRSSGTSALITVTNGYTGAQLIMDDSDPYNPTQRSISIPTYSPDACLAGFVWRLADPIDHVCVTTDQWAQTQEENKVAQAHRMPGTLDTCKQGYVWRLADPNDHVCVQPSSHDQAQWDNKLNLSRLATPLP